MGKKSRKRRDGFYSTNPDFDGFGFFDEPGGKDLPPSEQTLRVYIDKKGRRGKVVTVVDGFEGSEDALAELAGQLKAKCGVGGSAKDGLILLQGNLRDKVRSLMADMGYGVR